MNFNCLGSMKGMLRPPRNQSTRGKEVASSVSRGQGTPSGGEDSSLHIQRNGDREGTLVPGNPEGSIAVSFKTIGSEFQDYRQ